MPAVFLTQLAADAAENRTLRNCLKMGKLALQKPYFPILSVLLAY